MGNIPVAHEVTTSFRCLGDAIVGNPQGARERWRHYADESFIGSGVCAAVHASKGNMSRAEEYGKGMGRATGKIICGGGLLRDVPVLHELATCGESLGDMIGGGDDEMACQRWEQWADSSLIGSGVGSMIEARKGNATRAAQLHRAAGKAGAKASITVGATVATVAVTVATAGIGLVPAVAAGATMGATAGAAATAGVQAIDGHPINKGDVVGNCLLGGAAGALAGGMAARAGAASGTSAASAAEADAVLTGAAARGMRVSAISTAASTGASGFANEQLLVEVRETLRSRRGNEDVSQGEQGGEEMVTEEEQSPLQCANATQCAPTSEDEGVVDMTLECAICLECEVEFPGIQRVHHCGAGCAQVDVCPHAFHPECIQEWRMACERAGKIPTCPECRRDLSEEVVDEDFVVLQAMV